MGVHPRSDPICRAVLGKGELQFGSVEVTGRDRVSSEEVAVEGTSE